jgi:hypothetical protein
MKDYAWEDELNKIIDDYKDGDKSPLDGDETEHLSKIILAKLDLIEGNITEEEYLKKISLCKTCRRDGCLGVPKAKRCIHYLRR